MMDGSGLKSRRDELLHFTPFNHPDSFWCLMARVPVKDLGPV